MKTILVWLLSYKWEIANWWQMTKNEAETLHRDRRANRRVKGWKAA